MPLYCYSTLLRATQKSLLPNPQRKNLNRQIIIHDHRPDLEQVPFIFLIFHDQVYPGRFVSLERMVQALNNRLSPFVGENQLIEWVSVT